MQNLSPSSNPSNKIPTSKHKNRGVAVSNMQERLLKESIISPDFVQNDDSIIAHNLNEIQNLPPDSQKQNIFYSKNNAHDEQYHGVMEKFQFQQPQFQNYQKNRHDRLLSLEPLIHSKDRTRVVSQVKNDYGQSKIYNALAYNTNFQQQQNQLFQQTYHNGILAPQFTENNFLRQSSERHKNQHLSSITNKVITQYSNKQAAEITQFKPQKTQYIAQTQNVKNQESIYINPHKQSNLKNIQIKEKKQQSFLTILQPLEKEKFGDRCPKGFTKLGLLGKGGIALVWLAEINDIQKYGYDKKMLGQKVAIKQFPKSKGQFPIDNSAKIEIETGNILFPIKIKDNCDGSNQQDYERVSALDDKNNPGFNSIAKLIDQIEENKDVWLVYEVGDQCLGKHLSEVKGEFYKGERIYKVQHMLFYQILARDWKILRTFIIKMCEIFDVLSKFGIVHSDIKPDNILIQINEQYTDIQQLKLIDFGSAFQFHNVTQITGTTPEYLAPEILDYLEQRNKFSKSELSTAINLNQRSQPWSFDVWSLGIILLEIASGCPVWMSLKCRVLTVDGKSVLGSGLLGVQGREQKRIIQRQQQIFKNIEHTLKKFECYGLDKDPKFMDLLKRMLCFDSNKRISPKEIISHPFCTNKY